MTINIESLVKKFPLGYHLCIIMIKGKNNHAKFYESAGKIHRKLIGKNLKGNNYINAHYMHTHVQAMYMCKYVYIIIIIVTLKRWKE